MRAARNHMIHQVFYESNTVGKFSDILLYQLMEDEMLNEIIDAAIFWTGTLSVATIFGISIGEITVRDDKMCRRFYEEERNLKQTEPARFVRGYPHADLHPPRLDI